MKTSKQPIETIDFSQPQTSDLLLPQPAVLKSKGWGNLHFEHHRQPKFETPEHQGNWHVIAYCPFQEPSFHTAGERWLDGKRKREERHTGNIAIVPAGIAQRCNWNTLAQFTIVAIDPTLLKQIGQDWVNPDRIELIPRFMTEQDELMQGIISVLRVEVESSKIGGQLLIDSLKTSLAIHLLRNYCTTQPKLGSYSDGLSQSTLQKVIAYIREHLHQDLKLIEIAAIAQVSPYYFLRLFKQCMGVTPHQYILQQRLEKAKNLLLYSNLSIADVVSITGFCDQSHLTRYCKRILGVTPTELRRSRSQ